MILRGITCLTLDAERRVRHADLRLDPSGNIDSFLPPGRSCPLGEKEIDLSGRTVIPGLIQTHVHLCQSLMRGLAERLPLEPWLSQRIWPLEDAHDRDTLRVSARLGLLELLTGGTTAILDMGTTRHLDVILEACSASGIRAITGTALMDTGTGLPDSLRRDVEEALSETESLIERFPRSRNARVEVCLAPRFIPTVSEDGWRRLVALGNEADLLIHTHACETRGELEATRSQTGSLPFAYLDRVGAAGSRLRAAHGVWLQDPEEQAILRRSEAAIIHCPGSNAKLGSGTADVVSLWSDGVPVGIGSDGAACNNRLDAFEELRRAAHTMTLRHGPEAVEPARVLEMATRVGAKLLRLEDRIGSLEPGKAADFVVLNPELGAGLWAASGDPHAQILYGAGREHVEEVWIQGERLVQRGELRGHPTKYLLREAAEAADLLKRRIGDAR